MRASYRWSRRPVGIRAAAPHVAEPLEGRFLFSTYTVTTLGDGAGSVTPAGAGKFNATTLRAALNAANAAAGADTVNFAAAVTGTINLGSALPAVDDALTVAGPGASKLTVQRSSTASTGFSILRVNAGKTASVSGLKLTKGTGTRQANGDARGGGVLNAGTLTLTNCTVSANTAAGRSGAAATATTPATGGRTGLGGGIYNADTGTLVLVACTVSGNVAAGGTGGYNEAGAGNVDDYAGLGG